MDRATRRVSLALTLLLGLLAAPSGIVGQATGPAAKADSSEPISSPAPTMSPVAPATDPAVDPAVDLAAAAKKASAIDETLPGGLIGSTLALDISTASFYELADWLRSLGLSEKGGLEELRVRLYDYFGVKAPEAGKPVTRTVTIESADKALYGKGSGEGGLVHLSGGVRLTIQEGTAGDAYTITARELVYDRDRNSVYAEGNVVYTRKGQGRVEEFRGTTLAVDLGDWSGLFLDGVWRRDSASLGPDSLGQAGRGLVFAAATLDKSSGNYLTLLGARVSPTDRESPNFSLRAERMWFLGGNDWAMWNALLYVGEVPILWLPFFYYPSEEIFFHPVFGYRTREGSFLQTTTYLLGQKPPAKTGLILRLAPETGPTVPRGIFLKRVGSDASAKGAQAGGGSSSGTVKFMADLYLGLGAFAGLDASLPKLGPFSAFALSSGIGVSRSLFAVTGGYSPFSASGGWASVWNNSSFLGTGLPFRFGLGLTTNLTLSPVSATIDLPLYSDPFFETDFRFRNEDMDWLQLSKSATATATAPAKRTGFTQKLSLSATFAPSFLAPLVTSLSVSRLATTFTWRSKADTILAQTDDPALYAVDPSREFFAPDIFRPVDLGLEVAGTIFEFPVLSPPPSPAKKEGTTPEAALPIRPPWETEAPAAAEAGQPSGVGLAPPPLAPDPILPSATYPLAIKVTWGLQPAWYRERRFLTDSWQSSTLIDLAPLYDLDSWRLGANLGSSFSIAQRLVSGSASLTWSDQDQLRTVTEDPVWASTKQSLERSDAQFPRRKLVGSVKLSTQPLSSTSLFSASSLSWGLDSLLYSRAFSSFAGTVPLYKETFPAWDVDSITSHNIGATIVFRTGSTSQTLGLTMSLPPTKESWAGNLSLAAVIAGYSLGLTAQEKVDRDDKGIVTWNPFSAGIRAGSPFGLSASDSFVYDVAKSWLTSNTATLGWGWFSASLQAQRTKSYTPVANVGWQASTDESFVPSQFTLTLSPKYESPKEETAQLSVGASIAYSQSLLRFSDSTLSTTLSLSLAFGKGLSLTFSSQSQNRNTWRYWPELFPAAALLGDIRIAPLDDLLWSLSVWDPVAIRKGSFKLRNLSLKLDQDLEDWTLALLVQAAPKLDTVNRVYVIDPSASLTITWKDIPELKSAITYTNAVISW